MALPGGRTPCRKRRTQPERLWPLTDSVAHARRGMLLSRGKEGGILSRAAEWATLKGNVLGEASQAQKPGWHRVPLSGVRDSSQSPRSRKRSRGCQGGGGDGSRHPVGVTFQSRRMEKPQRSGAGPVPTVKSPAPHSSSGVPLTPRAQPCGVSEVLSSCQLSLLGRS